jgi:glycosyltransferase involved in cell wall biosynthesis
MRPAVLYVSYDGILEPLGESQVASYLEGLSTDHGITLLSFEKPDDLNDGARTAAMAQRLSEREIDWIPLKYHKRPPVLSTAFDAVAGIFRAWRVCRERHVRIVHARSYVPALIALCAQTASDATFLFDMRGFWVDEKVEAGHWKAGGPLYHIAKWWERRFYRAADAVVSLTDAGARSIPELGVDVGPRIPIEVIPTCVDLERFTPGPKDPALMRSLGLMGSTVIGCVGTMGNWYMRREMVDALGTLARSMSDLEILIVTRNDHETLRRDLEAAGVPRHRLALTSASFAEMPRYIRLFDAGLFFIRPSFSKRASTATKLGEFLACGVPVIINDGVGDSGAIVRARAAGIVLSELTPSRFQKVVCEIRSMLSDRSMSDRCRSTAEEIFDLKVGIERYRSLYRQLLTVQREARQG